MPRTRQTPQVLTEQLDRLKNRLRGISVAGGIGVTVFITVLLIAAALLADLFLDLSVGVRVALLAAAMLAAAGTALVTTLLPLLRRMQDPELAACVEDHYPEFEERLLSTIEFTEQEQDPNSLGSPLMQKWLISQTVQTAGRLDFAEAVDARPAIRRCWLGGAALLGLMLPLLFAGEAYGLLVSRFLNPWGNYARIQNLMLTVLDGDRVVPRRSDVTIEANVDWRFGEGKRPPSAWLEWTSDAGRTERRRLDWNRERNAYAGLLPRVENSFSYHVSAAKARTRDYRIEVVEPPEVREFGVDVAPPAYTGEPAQRHDAVLGEIVVIEQSRLELTAAFNKPVRSAELLWLDRRPRVPTRTGSDRNQETLPDGTPIVDRTELELAADGMTAALTTLASLEAPSGRYVLRVSDEHGLTSELRSLRRLTVVPDAAPEIYFADREQTSEAKPDDRLAIPVVATDDFGLASLELHYEFTRTGNVAETGVIVAPGEILGRRGAEHRFRLDLSELKLTSGIQLSIRARATDERPVPGPNESWSETRVISIKNDARPYGDQTLAEQQHRTDQVLGALKSEVEKQRQQAKELQEQAKSDVAEEIDFQRDGDVQAMHEKLEQLQEQLERLSAMFQQQPLFDDLARQAQEIARQSLSRAAGESQQAQQSETKQKPEHLGKTADELGKAAQDLARMQQDYNELAQLQRDLLELNRLAAHTERLAEDVGRMEQRHQALQAADAASDGQERRRLEAEQQRLMQDHQHLEQELGDLTDRRPELLDAARRDLFEKLGELGERAEQLAREQTELAQATTKAGREKGQEQRPLSREQQQLQAEAEKLADALDLPKSKNPPAQAIDEMKQAQEAFNKGDLQRAKERQREAVKNLEELARTLEKNARLPGEPAKAARELARRQQDLADQLDRADPNTAGAEADERRRLRAEEAAIQSALSKLPEQDESRPHKQTAQERIRQADEALRQGDLDAARQPARQAAEGLNELAEALDREQQARQELADKAGDLAGRQKEVAERVSELDPGNGSDETDQQRKALQKHEAELHEATGELSVPKPQQSRQKTARNQLRKAEQALEKGHLAEAGRSAQQAAQSLGELAEALAGPMPATDPDEAAERSRQAGELARRQRDLADRLDEALAQSPPQQAPPQQPPMNGDDADAAPAQPVPPDEQPQPAQQLPAEQSRLAGQSQRLGEQVKSLNLDNPQANEAADQFPKSAGEAAESARRLEFAECASCSRQAAASARQLAESLENESVPESLKKAAGTAAAQQQRLAEQFDQLARSASARQQMQAGMQQQIQQVAGQLSEELAQTAESLGAQPLNEQNPAEQTRSARESARQASQSASQAGSQMQQGNQGTAGEAGEQAAEQLREAARQARQAAGQNPVQGKRADENKVPGEVGQQVAQAARQLSSAGEQLARYGQLVAKAEQPGDDPSAEAPQAMGEAPDTPGEGELEPGGEGGDPAQMSVAEALRQAAESMRQAAGQMGLGTPQQPGPSDQQQGDQKPSDSPGDEAADFGAEQLARLLELEVELGDVTQRDWGKLPGELETELLDAAQRRPDGEYARLIRRYFEEISKARMPSLNDSED